MMGKRWEESEDAIIRSFWKKEGHIRDYMHLLPGRSKQSIEKRGEKLSLGPRKLWSAEQNARLAEIWRTGGRVKAHLHEFPGHSIMAVYTHAHVLGLGKRGKRGYVAEAPSWLLIQKELKRADLTCERLIALTKFNKATVYKHLSEQHGAKSIHIAAWERSPASRKPVPVYRYGAGEDAPKPVPLKGSAKEKKYRLADQHRRVLAGETVRTINPFAAAAGLVQAPVGQQGRVFKQDMSVDEWHQPRRVA